MNEAFATALSEKPGELAIKEVSLKIKSFLPKSIRILFVLFTHHYQPLTIIKAIKKTLNPMTIIGIQAPRLIYDNRTIKKGIIGCAINKKTTEFKEFFLKTDSQQEIEHSLRLMLQDIMGSNYVLYSFIPPQYHYSNYLRALELSAGKSLKIFGAGYSRKYSHKHYYSVNDTIKENLLILGCKGFSTSSIRIGGFLPLGKPFTITKVLSQAGIISEINNKPAIEIYKHYLEDKYETFIKNHFFFLYPLGIKDEFGTRLISVVDCTDNGSLLCLGNIKENAQAQIMLMHAPSMIETLKKKLEPIRNSGEGLLFMVNSLIRKRILMDSASEEVSLIKQYLGESFRIIGVYSDYSIFTDINSRDIDIESGNLLITKWL